MKKLYLVGYTLFILGVGFILGTNSEQLAASSGIAHCSEGGLTVRTFVTNGASSGKKIDGHDAAIHTSFFGGGRWKVSRMEEKWGSVSIYLDKEVGFGW